MLRFITQSCTPPPCLHACMHPYLHRFPLELVDEHLVLCSLLIPQLAHVCNLHFVAFRLELVHLQLSTQVIL